MHGDIDIPPFLFKNKKGSTGHKYHILFARKVFVKCVDQLLGLRNDFWAHSLHEELVSNEVRLKEALTLIKANKSQIEQVSSKLYRLTQDDLSASKKQVLDFGKSFFPGVIRQLKADEKEDLAQALEKIQKTRLSKPADIALIYSEALKKFQETLFQKRSTYYTVEILHDPVVSTVKTFIDFAVWRLLTFYD